MSHNETGGRTETIRSVETSLLIIETLRDLGSAGINEIAEKAELTDSTVYKHLNTLLKNEFVIKTEDGYRLGMKFLEIGGSLRDDIPGAELIKDTVRHISNETNQTAHFTVEDHGRSIIIYVFRGGVHTRAHVGSRFYMHQVAAGKAILSQMSESDVKAVIARHGLPAVTDHTITTEEELFEELDLIREQGVAFNRQESADGLHAVAVPLMVSEDRVLGAFTIVGPASRLQGDPFTDEYPAILRDAVNELELNIRYREI